GQPLPSRIVLIRDAENQPVIIEQISADEPAISCRWAAGPETMATVRIMVDRSRLRDGRTKGTLTVQTSPPVRQALTIPGPCASPGPSLSGGPENVRSRQRIPLSRLILFHYLVACGSYAMERARSSIQGRHQCRRNARMAGVCPSWPGFWSAWPSVAANHR